MKGLIVSSGEIKDYKLLEQMVKEHDYIVCADGGVNHILKIDILPDIVLGDLDSIGKEELDILEKENIKIQKFPVMKDETDTELCIDYLLEGNFKEITLIGVTGTRLDHTISNIYLLKKIYLHGVKACIINENNRIYYENDEMSLGKRDNHYVSIIPLAKEGAIISLDGFLYPLKMETLEFSTSKGISNKVLESFGKIKIHKGEVLIIESKD